MCSYCLSFVHKSFPSHDELLVMFTNIGLGQYENQNVSRLNHDFCHFVVDFKEFFVGGEVGMPNVNVLVLLSLPHVIANHLNLKYICHAVMDEWLMYLTKGKDVGVPAQVSPDLNYKISTP